MTRSRNASAQSAIANGRIASKEAGFNQQWLHPARSTIVKAVALHQRGVALQHQEVAVNPQR